MPTESRSASEVSTFLTAARERFKLASEAESETRAKALEDLKFYDGEQWPDDIKAQRDEDGRPCLVSNVMKKFVRQVTNEQRQQDTGIEINPIGDGADTDTAEVLQGMIRHIELQSEAEIVYNSAFQSMVISGFAFWRVITDYIDDDGFDQEIKIQRIKNQFTVYFDPAAVQPDYSDAGFCFIIEDLLPEDFKEQYPDADAASLNEFSSIGDSAPGWGTKNTIRVAEYFHVEKIRAQLHLLEDGSIVSELPEGVKAVRSRDVFKRKVRWAKITGTEILEEREWAGKWIPVVPVLGDDLDIDGTRSLCGLVRDAKDPQRQKNFMESAATEAIALAPKAPWVTVAGTTENYPEWETANTRNHSRLRWDTEGLNGQPGIKPERNAVEPPIQAMSMMIRQADENLKGIIGLYDPSLGTAKSDQSGSAIKSLQQQGDVGTLNYADNLTRSKRHTGRIILDLIPKIYDTARVQRIVKPDGSSDAVQITNSQAQQEAQAENPATEMMTQ